MDFNRFNRNIQIVSNMDILAIGELLTTFFY